MENRMKILKNGITYVISHNYRKIKVDSYNTLPLKKTMNFHNAVIIIKSVWNKEKVTTTMIYS